MSSEDSAAETGQPRTSALSELRDVSDARTLRALTHPVRIALLEALHLGGAMTATQIGEEIGESPTTCSFHLRQLAKYGFVEEAGGGKGRARPWKLTSIGMNIHGVGDPEAEIAAATLSRLVTDRQIARFQAWTRSRGSYPREWRDAASTSDWILFLTPDELKQFNDELAEVIVSRFRERITDPSKRPPGALPVEYLLFSFPIAVPGADPGSAPQSSAPQSSAPESGGEPTA